MAFENYQSLQDSVQSFLVRNDPKTVAQIPTFIHLAETEVYKLIDLPFSEGLFITSGANPPVPDDVLSIKSVFVDNRPYTRLTPEAFFRLAPHRDGQYYTIHDGVIQFYQGTDNNSEIVMHYKKRLTHMKASTDTNELLQTAPDLLLYVTLRHACSFIRDREQEQFWDAKASDAATTLKNSLDDFWYDRAPVVPQP